MAKNRLPRPRRSRYNEKGAEHSAADDRSMWDVAWTDVSRIRAVVCTGTGDWTLMTNAVVKHPIDLVAFDLDGTLLRGDTVCLAIATRLGRRERMFELERLTSREDIRAAREEMATWYRAVPMTELLASLETLQFAPGRARRIRASQAARHPHHRHLDHLGIRGRPRRAHARRG